MKERLMCAIVLVFLSIGVQAEEISYRNRRMGIRLALPETWKGYRAVEKRVKLDGDTVSRVVFLSLPVPHNGTAGKMERARILAVAVCDRALCRGLTAGPAAGEYAVTTACGESGFCVLFAALREDACPAELLPRLREVPAVIRSLRLDDGDSTERDGNLDLRKRGIGPSRAFYMLFRWAFDRSYPGR